MALEREIRNPPLFGAIGCSLLLLGPIVEYWR